MNAMLPDNRESEMAQRANIDSRLGELRQALAGAPSGPSVTAFIALHSHLDTCAGMIKRRLLGSPLAWTDEEKTAAAWLYSASLRTYRLGQRLVDARKTLADDGALDAAMLALHYAGEAAKQQIAAGRQEPFDYRGVHGLMKAGIASGRNREARRFLVDGRWLSCTLESIYFRTLLLAKSSSGNLNSKQIEILDAWLWAWTPTLHSVPDAPEGSPLRADLDSRAGLLRGASGRSEGASLYLPTACLEEAYRAVVEEFHAGRIFPPDGFTAEFRIEEHVAVLNLLRQELLDARREPKARAERRAAGFEADVLVGFSEIMARGFQGGIAPTSKGRAQLNIAAAFAREHQDPTSTIYEPARRRIRWVDESATGLGATWRVGECGEISVGDLLGIRRSPGQPLIVGRVVRSVPSPDASRTEIGVSILSDAAQPMTVKRSDSGYAPGIDVLFVPGADTSGRHDAYLVPERLYREPGALEAEVGGRTYTFRFNRMRERGNGWALAGYEITSTRATAGA